ncbi:MAG: diaminopimelate decarboxylase [Solirubrobacterales bacterium]
MTAPSETLAPPAIDGSAVYPASATVNDRGHLEIGGCDTVELAREFGTPAYVFDEHDLRDRARAYTQAFTEAGGPFEVLYASKAFPATAAYRLFREEGLAADVASGGELYLALRAGFAPEQIYLHGNNKLPAELRAAFDAGVGHVIVDSLDEIERADALLDRPQRVLIRLTPDIRPATHRAVSTGQLDSKFGFSLQQAPEAIRRIAASGHLQLVGLHVHIGSQIFETAPYERAIEALAPFADTEPEIVDVGGGLGVAYAHGDEPPDVAAWARLVTVATRSIFGDDVKILAEPGRALVANPGVTLYRVGSIKEIPGVRTYVAVDGGMSDNLRPMLYESRYETVIADRAGEPADATVTVAGMHCESGDVLVRDAQLASPRVGDVLVTPATGAYGHAMANNYNGIPRPPVVFCADGDARVVVRRETWDDLAARDVS